MAEPEHPALPNGPASATVFITVLTRGPVSRVEIARGSGLSSAAVTKAARPYLDAGYLVELPARARLGPGAGRPANPLAINPEREYFVGVKLTADELIGVVTDLSAQPVASARRRIGTDTTSGSNGTNARTSAINGGTDSSGDADVDHVVRELSDLVAELLEISSTYRSRCHWLGLALAGDVDSASGVVRYSPFLGWRRVPLAEMVANATGLTVTIENDVTSLAVAERWFGDGVGVASFAVVTVGVGIGCGLVVADRVIGGSRGVAGEIGHIPVGGDQPACHCGARGCVEAIAGSDAIVAAIKRSTGDDTLDIAEAIDRAHASDPAATAAFARAGRAIGAGMAAMANLFGPERIILTGDEAGLASYRLLDEHITAAFAGQAFGAAADCPIIVRRTSFEHWARGAAAVAINARFTLDRPK